jgi:hypothetical protein
MPDLLGRAQRDGVIALREHLARTSEQPVDPHRDPDGEPAGAARQALLPGRLDDHVQVIRLDRVLHETKAEPLFALGKRSANDLHATLGSQARHAAHAHREVLRDRTPDRRPSFVDGAARAT